MADEYILRSIAIAKLTALEVTDPFATIADAKRVLADMAAADVAPVVHGRWIDGAEDFTCGNHNAECSICRCYVSWDGCDEDFNYCPNCGARMDGVNEGE